MGKRPTITTRVRVKGAAPVKKRTLGERKLRNKLRSTNQTVVLDKYTDPVEQLKRLDTLSLVKEKAVPEAELYKERETLYILNSIEYNIVDELIKEYGEKLKFWLLDEKLNICQWSLAQCEERLKAYKVDNIASKEDLIRLGTGLDRSRYCPKDKRNRNIFGYKIVQD